MPSNVSLVTVNMINSAASETWGILVDIYVVDTPVIATLRTKLKKKKIKKNNTLDNNSYLRNGLTSALEVKVMMTKVIGRMGTDSLLPFSQVDSLSSALVSVQAPSSIWLILTQTEVQCTCSVAAG